MDTAWLGARTNLSLPYQSWCTLCVSYWSCAHFGLKVTFLYSFWFLYCLARHFHRQDISMSFPLPLKVTIIVVVPHQQLWQSASVRPKRKSSQPQFFTDPSQISTACSTASLKNFIICSFIKMWQKLFPWQPFSFLSFNAYLPMFVPYMKACR